MITVQRRLVSMEDKPPTRAQRIKTLRAELRHTQMENRLALNNYLAGRRKAKRLGQALSELRKQGKVKHGRK